MSTVEYVAEFERETGRLLGLGGKISKDEYLERTGKPNRNFHGDTIFYFDEISNSCREVRFSFSLEFGKDQIKLELDRRSKEAIDLLDNIDAGLKLLGYGNIERYQSSTQGNFPKIPGI